MTSIVQHRIVGARRVDSPNQNERPDDEISLIVIHGISLPEGRYGGQEIEQLFCNALDTSVRGFRNLKGVEVSSHLLIRRDGEIIQFVPFDRRAWHAGESRFGLRGNCNDFSIGIELEGTDYQAYTKNQYQVLGEVCRALMLEYGVGNIVGHEHISPGRKSDPGPAFSWPKLRGALAASL